MPLQEGEGVTFPQNNYYLDIYVSAKHFNYSSAESCLRALASNRGDCRFGHAWVSLYGLRAGKAIAITGGHSGELGYLQPRYFDGVADLVEIGDPNPIRYLWAIQKDGFFQEGSGGHKPTYAARRYLTAEEYEIVATYITNYHYGDYAFINRQCTSFVIEIAGLVNWKLEGDITLPVAPSLYFKREKVKLWEDSRYAFLTFFTPDRLEQSLRAAVALGQAKKIDL